MKQVFVETKAMMGDLTYGKKPKKGNPQQKLVRVKGFFPARRRMADPPGTPWYPERIFKGTCP